MKTIRSLVELSSGFLEKKGVSSPRRESEDLLAFCLGIKRLDLYLDYDRPVEVKEVDCFRSLIEKRSKRMPYEYITGCAPFFDLELIVNQDVLIPRSETEVCLDQIFKKHDLSGKVVWDICTGSGAIGLACKSRFPASEVSLSDICEKALAVAEINGERHGLNVRYKQGDLLEPFQGEKADVVFVNPPYITEEAFKTLEPEVRDFEPKKALVGGDTGLDFYEKLAQQLSSVLKVGGYVFLEIGADQKLSVTEIFNRTSCFVVSYVKDYAGVSRFISLEFSQKR